jgi:hypothetical protein
MRRRRQQKTLFNLTVANFAMLALNTALLLTMLSTRGDAPDTGGAVAMPKAGATAQAATMPATSAVKATAATTDTTVATETLALRKPGERRAKPSAPSTRIITNDTTPSSTSDSEGSPSNVVRTAPTASSGASDTEEQAIMRAFFSANIQQLRLAVMEAGENPKARLPLKADVELAIASSDITSDASSSVLFQLREGFGRYNLPFQDPIVQ